MCVFVCNLTMFTIYLLFYFFIIMYVSVFVFCLTGLFLWTLLQVKLGPLRSPKENFEDC